MTWVHLMWEYRDVEHDSQIPKCVCKLAQELQHARNQLLSALKFVDGPVLQNLIEYTPPS